MSATAPGTASGTERLVSALADLVTAVRDHHPDVPAIEASVGEVAGPGRRRTAAHAHRFTLRRRTGGEGQAHDPAETAVVFDLVIAPSVPTGGAAAVLDVVLHAATHARNDHHRVTDTSREGRYHNALFRTAAEQLGLEVADAGGDGWAATSVPDTTATVYQARLDALTSVITAYGVPDPAGADTASAGRSLLAVCGCTPVRRIRVTRSVLAAGPIRCELCSQRFRLVEPATTTS